jgi:hypothetical protein
MYEVLDKVNKIFSYMSVTLRDEFNESNWFMIHYSNYYLFMRLKVSLVSSRELAQRLWISTKIVNVVL